VSDKWKTRSKLLAAGALVGLGIDTATLSSRPLMAIGGLLVLIGSAWFVATLLGARRDGLLYRNRAQILLALGTASLTLILVVTAALAVRLGPRHFARDNQSYDAALGWGPPDIPNRVGQRGDIVDPAAQHLVMIGDSILYGHGVAGPDTAAAHLDQMLPDLQVLNLSVSGYSIDQYYVYLKRALPTLHPKLVVVGIFGGNDYEVTGLEYGWGHTKPLFHLRERKLVLHNPDLLADNCIDHLAQSLLFRALWASKERALDLIHFFCDPAKLRPDELEGVIGTIFTQIENEARAQGAAVLYVLLPLSNHLRLWEQEWTYRNKYERLRSMLEAGKHEYFEFYPYILRSVGQDDHEIFLDGAHYTPKGHALLAQAVASEIRERGLSAHPDARPSP